MSQLTPAALTTLQAMAATGTAFLTAADGQELLTANLIVIDVNQTNPENPSAFLCTLTEAGTAQLTAPVAAPVAAAPVVAAAAPTFDLRADIVVPAIKRGGATGPREKKESIYPFAIMEIGQSFHVGPGEDIDKVARTISTQVSNANKDSKVPAVPPAIVIVTKRRAKKGPDGKSIVVDGKRQMESYQEDEQAMKQTKFFVSRKVNADDPQGPGIRVFRIAEPTEAA